MLGENIKNIRKAKGLSQEDLALRLNVVRQTVSKWETGLSVPDSEMLIKIAEVLETSVSEILGEAVAEKPSDGIKELAEKLESLNMQIAKINDSKRRSKRRRYGIVAVLAFIIMAVSIGSLMFDGHTKDAVGIIGGADGPTAIFVTGVFPPYELIALVAACILVMAMIGIYANRRK